MMWVLNDSNYRPLTPTVRNDQWVPTVDSTNTPEQISDIELSRGSLRDEIDHLVQVLTESFNEGQRSNLSETGRNECSNFPSSLFDYECAADEEIGDGENYDGFNIKANFEMENEKIMTQNADTLLANNDNAKNTLNVKT